VSAACRTPLLNLKFELRPSWNNIHGKFPTGTTPDTTLLYWGHAKKSYGWRGAVGAVCFLRFALCYISFHSRVAYVNVAKFTLGPLRHVLTRPQWIASELYSVGIVTGIAGNELARWLQWREDCRWGNVNRSRDIWRRSILGTCFWGHSWVFRCLNGTVCISGPPDSTCIAFTLSAFTLHFHRSDFNPSGRPEL